MRMLLLAALRASACPAREWGAESLPPGDYKPRKEDGELPLPKDIAAGLRNDAFARAKVWREPSPPVPEAELTEGGRKLLASGLRQLRDEQIYGLFDAAGFARYGRGPDANRDLDGWVGAFKAKVAEIADGPGCPTP